MDDFGALTLIPTLVVFTLAVLTHRPIESLIAGSLVGLIMIHGTGFIGGFAEASIRVMTDDDVAWVILVCGFMGSLIGISGTLHLHLCCCTNKLLTPTPITIK